MEAWYRSYGMIWSCGPVSGTEKIIIWIFSKNDINSMRSLIIKNLGLLLLFFSTANGQKPQLEIGMSNRYLIDGQGNPVFLIGDTGWKIAQKLNRDEVEYYVETRKAHGFNTIGIAAIFGDHPINSYGDEAFEKTDDIFDPGKPLVTPGNDPLYENEYDYWDHLDYVLEVIKDNDMYVAMVVSFNSWVIDPRRNFEPIFNVEKAYAYGNWLGQRYRRFDNLIWMLGGDRPAVFEDTDKRNVFSAMAEGIADGVNGEDLQNGKADYSQVLISYHPRKAEPRSSIWFHNEEWLRLNSIQACPSDIGPSIEYDINLKPVKPTWLFEGRYEYYTFSWKASVIRNQAYITLFSGAFGHMYGHVRIWQFDENWKTALFSPGALDMQHMYHLISKHIGKYNFTDLKKSDQILANENLGRVTENCWKGNNVESPTSDILMALSTENRELMIVYSGNGRDILLHREAFLDQEYETFWYNPRTGTWNVTENDRDVVRKTPFESFNYFQSDEDILSFDPPGSPKDDNDWILLLEIKVKSKP